MNCVNRISSIAILFVILIFAGINFSAFANSADPVIEKQLSCNNSSLWEEAQVRLLCEASLSLSSCNALNTLTAGLSAGFGYKVFKNNENKIIGKQEYEQTKRVYQLAEEAGEKIAVLDEKLHQLRLQRYASGNLKNIPDAEVQLRNQIDEIQKSLQALRDSQRFMPGSDRVHVGNGPQYVGLPQEMNGIEDDHGFAQDMQNYTYILSQIRDLKTKMTELEAKIRNLDRIKTQESWIEPLRAEYLQELNSVKAQIAKLQGEAAVHRSRGLGKVKSFYMSAKYKSSGIAIKGAAFAGVVALPVIEMLKEPTLRTLCGSYSDEETEIMGEIGAQVSVKNRKCSVDIPNDALMKAIYLPQEKRDKLPKKVCEGLKDKIYKMRERQSSELLNGKKIRCDTDASGSFAVDFNVNNRSYTHTYSRLQDGSFKLSSSFFPNDPKNQQILSVIPSGESRFRFSINLVPDAKKEYKWTEVESPLNIWNTFRSGSPLTTQSQGFENAIQYYQTGLDQDQPPTADLAKQTVLGNTFLTKYIFSVGEQMNAAKRYLDEAIKTCNANRAKVYNRDTLPNLDGKE